MEKEGGTGNCSHRYKKKGTGQQMVGGSNVTREIADGGGTAHDEIVLSRGGGRAIADNHVLARDCHQPIG
jgi:hypothetical protein